jgi:hypothetical protein
MPKSTQASQQFFSRTGNASTKASATGVNLLGWDAGVREFLTPLQEREVLLSALKSKEAMRAAANKDSPEYDALGKEITALCLKLRWHKQVHALQRRHQEVGHFLIQQFKERVTPHEWSLILAEARRRYECQESLTGLRDLLAQRESDEGQEA